MDNEIKVIPSIPLETRVRYTTDGIVSGIYGKVKSVQWNSAYDCLEYFVEWEDGDKSYYFKQNLYVGDGKEFVIDKVANWGCAIGLGMLFFSAIVLCIFISLGLIK